MLPIGPIRLSWGSAVAISKELLWDTLAAVVAELERADSQSLVAVRVRGLLDARALISADQIDRHKRSDRAERDDKIVGLYLSGLSTYDVSRELSMDVGAVRCALQRRNVTLRAKGQAAKAARMKRDEPRIDRIRAMRAEGKTLEEVGSELHITRERVRQLCVRYDIPVERGLTPDQKQAVAEYVSGESLEQVAARHSASPSTVRGWITKDGFAVRPSNKIGRRDPETLKRAQLAAGMYQGGKSVREISEELGYGHEVGGVVYRLLAIAGVKPDRGAFRAQAKTTSARKAA